MTSYRDEILLGVVQGFTEFLPISSSGHLKALEIWLKSPLANDLGFDIFVHLATLAAVFIVFRKDFASLFAAFRTRSETQIRARDLLIQIVVGAIPAGVVGLLVKDSIESLPERYPHAISLGWVGTAGVLFSLIFLPRDREPRPLTVRAALWVGCWQIVALLPGVSRSGTTIAAALWWGLDRKDAARFSFLCATPLILGATAKEFLDLSQKPGGLAIPVGYWVGGAVAAVTGYVALRLLLRMLRGGSLHWWALYLVAVAGAYSTWLIAH